MSPVWFVEVELVEEGVGCRRGRALRVCVEARRRDVQRQW